MNEAYHKKQLEELNVINATDLNLIALPNNERSKNINRAIREKYSIDDEISILRKIHLGKITDEEFKEYSDYVDECVERYPEDGTE